MAVTQVYDGDTKGLEAAYAKMERENIKLRESLHKTVQESKQGHGDLTGLVNGHVAGLAKLAGGLVSVHKVVESVTEAYSEWRAELKALGDEHARFTDNLTRVVGYTGDVAEAERVEAFASHGAGAATREELIQAFRQVSGATPTSSYGRREELAGAAAQLAPLVDVNELGRLMGGLSEAMPERGGMQVAGVGLRLMNRAGDQAGQLSSDSFLRAMKVLQKGGMAVEDSLAFGISALQQDLSPKLLEQVAAAVESPAPATRHRGRRLTPEEEAQNRLAGAATIGERLDLVFRDEELRRSILGDKGAAEFELISGDAMGRERALLASAGSYAQQQIIAARTDRGGVGQAWRLREAQKRRELATREDADRGLEAKIAGEEFEANIAAQHWTSKWVSRRGRDIDRMLRDSGVTAAGRAGIEALGGQPAPSAEAQQQQLQVQREQRDLLREQNGLLRQLGRQTPAGAHSE